MLDLVKRREQQQEDLASDRYSAAGAWAENRKALREWTDRPDQRLRRLEDARRRRLRFSLLDQRDGLAHERILGTTNLMSVNYLAQGQRASRSVCRIQIRNRSGRSQGFGTGFLVSPNLLLTNHHVIDAPELALRSLAEFDFEDDEDFNPKDSTLFNLDQGRFFYTNAELDFTLVAVKPQSVNRRRRLREFGFLRLVADSGKALVGEPVSIIQHPDGGDKKIAIRENRVLGTVDAFIHYETDTLPGSSGAPVLNDQWETVAIHHAGVPEKNRNGSVLADNGRVWKPEMGDERKRWIANEGVRISAIFSDLRGRDHWDDGERRLLRELGIAPESPAPGPEIGAPPAEESAPPIRAIGVEDFYRLLTAEEVTEQDLRPYVRLDPEASGAFRPAFRLDRAKVAGIRSDQVEPLLTWADSWSESIARRRYRRRIRGPAVRAVSLGDSWLRCPFVLHGIVDHLMDRDDLAVYSIGTEGKRLLEVIAGGTYLDAIERENPSCFLLGMGGTDLFGEPGLPRLLHPFDRQRQAAEYPNQAFDALVTRIESAYEGLFGALEQRFPELRILCHGYDYFRPDGGPWLGTPLARHGIQDQDLQRQIVVVLIDRLNRVLEKLASRHPSVTRVDLRGSVSPDQWADELHPDSAAFGDLATLFAEAMYRELHPGFPTAR